MSSEETAFLSKADIRTLQEKALRDLLDYVQLHSPFYRAFFLKHSINSAKIQTLEDLQQIPTTNKEDMQLCNWDFLCVDQNKIAEYMATSGTLGSPVTIALTKNDLDRLAYNECLSFQCAEGTASDVYQLMLTLDRQFMAGIAYYSGLRRLGAGIIRLGPGIPALQWETIQHLKPTAIVAVPSLVLKMIDYAIEKGIDLNSASVTKALCIGENIRNPDFSLNSLGKKITEAWNIRLFSTYASTEMQTAFTECSAAKGNHQQPDLVIVELLDEDGHEVAKGEPGELTITTLGVEGMPLLRYRTGDICSIADEPCSCGRNSNRLSPVLGRKKQMIKLKGTTLYPPTLFDLLNSMEEIQDYVAEVFLNELGTDEVLLHILPSAEPEKVERNIRVQIQARLRVIPSIRFVAMEEIQRLQFPEGSRKARKFIDKRI